jgi:hypothetical protein
VQEQQVMGVPVSGGSAQPGQGLGVKHQKSTKDCYSFSEYAEPNKAHASTAEQATGLKESPQVNLW